MPRHIFISYKHTDEPFINQLEAYVREAGFLTWTDRELLAGDDWRQGIDDAIRASFGLIVVMTPDARASEYVTYEWSFAWGIGVKVIPIMLRKTVLHPRLDSLQYLNFTGREDKYPWNKLIERLQKLYERFQTEEVDDLIKELRSSKIAERLEAAQRLGDIKATKAIQALVSVIERDRSRRVRETAIGALEKIGTEEALNALKRWRGW